MLLYFGQLDKEISMKKTMEITLKSLPEIMLSNDCWFDGYGNLISKYGKLSPAFFNELGKTITVNVGCGFSLPETDWLKVLPKENKKWI